MARDFYLYKHGNGKYYAEILSPETGVKIAVRSTGETEREKALIKVAGWLATGIPAAKREKEKPRDIKAVKSQAEIVEMVRSAADLDGEGAAGIAQVLREKGLLSFNVAKPGPGREQFASFLLRFWDYEVSPYIREKLAHGQNFGRRHAYEMQSRVNAFYADYFKGRALGSITRADIKAFGVFLTQRREKPKGYRGQFAEKLSASYINKILIAGITALKWAYREGLTAQDVTAGLVRFSGETKKRGVLTPQEAKAIFALPWKDRRAYAGNLVAATTGLRAGEVLALRRSDIEDRILNVRHSWSTMDLLKSPKNGEARRVPLLPEVRAELQALLDESPYKAMPDPFIFYSALPNQPMDAKILIAGLKEACKAAGIDAEARGIVFHSWRHFFSSRMADKAAAEEIMRVTGHRDKGVFGEYADHIERENLQKMERVARKVMGKILPFSDKAAGE